MADELARALAQLGATVGVLHGDPALTGGFHCETRDYTRIAIPLTADRWQRWALFDQFRPQSEVMKARSDLMAAVSQFAPDVVLIMDYVNQPSEFPNWLLERGIPLIRYVLHAEDVCSMIDPVFALGEDPRCRAPLSPTCVDCCVRQGFGDEPTIRAAVHTRSVRQRLLYEGGYARLLFPGPGFRDYFAASMPFPRERSALVEPGVDPVTLPERGEWKPGDPVVFEYLGTLSRRKGALLVQEVFSRERLTSRVDYRLLFHGFGEPGVVDRVLSANANARFPGVFQEDDRALILANATVGLAPTYFESFHRVTRELLLAGVPVIGTDTFPQNEIIADGRNGLLIPAGDADALEAAVLTLLEHPERIQDLRRGASETPVRGVRASAVEVLEHVARVLEMVPCA
jgi:glycosyltransferase involved in cell wall biosynthesis